MLRPGHLDATRGIGPVDPSPMGVESKTLIAGLLTDLQLAWKPLDVALPVMRCCGEFCDTKHTLQHVRARPALTGLRYFSQVQSHLRARCLALVRECRDSEKVTRSVNGGLENGSRCSVESHSAGRDNQLVCEHKVAQSGSHPMDNALCRKDDAGAAGLTGFGHAGDPRVTAGTRSLLFDKQVKRWFEPSVRQVISLVSASQGAHVGQPYPYDESEPLKLAGEPLCWRWDAVRGRGVPPPPALIGRD
jgi:hypothetical protein